jgi:N-acetylneuraminic acid mutarotase
MKKLLLPLFIFFIFGCKKEEKLNIITSSYEIVQDSILLHGNLISTGDNGVSEVGFNLWLTDADYVQIFDTNIRVATQPQTGPFQTKILNNSDPNNHLFVRAYAKSNSVEIFANHIEIEELNLIKPRIQELIPSSGVAGDAVIIKGEYFGYNGDYPRVYINNERIYTTQYDSISILFHIPEYEFTSEVEVVIRQGDFTIISPQKLSLVGPRIDSFDPKESEDNFILTIRGDHFATNISQNKMTIGGHEAKILECSSSLIKAEVDVLNTMPGDHPILLTSNNISCYSAESISFTTPWVQLPSKPDDPVKNPAVFYTNNSIYFCCGSKAANSTGGYHNLVYKYDISTTLWTKLNNFPGEKRSSAISYNINDEIYLGLGYSAYGDYMHDLFKYNVDADSWAAIEVPDFGGKTTGISFVREGKAYLLSSLNLSKFHSFDPITNEWTQLATFPKTYDAWWFHTFKDGELYILYSRMFENTEIYHYDFDSDEWDLFAALDENFRANYVFPYNNKTYILEYQRDEATDFGYFSFFEYDILNHSKEYLHAFPGEYRYSAAGIIVDNVLYFGMGSNGYVLRKDLWKYEFKD